MTVRKNSNGRWFVDIVWTHPDGSTTRVRKTSPHKTRRGTEQYERQVRSELAAGTYGDRAMPLFKDAMEDYLTLVVEPKRKAATVKLYRFSARKYLLPEFGSMRVDQIGARQIARFVVKLRKDLEPPSVNAMIAPLRGCLKTCVEWGDLDAVPKIPHLRVVPPEVKVLDESEASQLLSALAEPWRTAALVALRTGVRVGELLALQWDDIDGRKLHVKRRVYLGEIGTPKGGKARVVPLTSEALDALKNHPKTLRSPWIFTSPQGRIYSYNVAYSGLARAVDAAELQDVAWHTLRHTCAAILTSRSGNLRVVQQILGHSKIETTMRYAHLLPGTLDGIEVLDGYGTIAASQKEKAAQDEQ